MIPHRKPTTGDCAMASPGKYRVPGKPYAEPGKIFMAEFSDFLLGDPNAKFPIRRLFEIFPINPETSQLAQEIIARGDLARNNQRISNSGPFIDAVFNDETLKAISIPIEETVSCSYSTDKGAIKLTFDPGDEPDISFANLPIEFNISSNQRFESIEINPTGTIYGFHARDDENDKTLVWVDFNLDFPTLVDPTDASALDDPGDPGGDGDWTKLIWVFLCACLSQKNPVGKPTQPEPCPDSWCNSADCVAYLTAPDGSKIYGAHFLFDAFGGSDPDVLIGKIIRIYNAGNNSFPLGNAVLVPKGQFYRIQVTTVNQDATSPYRLSFYGFLQ